jgi:hypothetical protein
MDPSLLLSALAAPIVVGIGVGWISNRWSSSHGWLRAEVESRSKYYADVLVAGQELREAVARKYEFSAFLNDYEPSGADGELEPELMEAKTQTEEYFEQSVATWRGQAKKAPLFAAAVVSTPIQASEGALDRVLISFRQDDSLPLLRLKCRLLDSWTQAIEATIERDMVDLRLRAIRGLPWRQRRAEKMHLKEISSGLEQHISEISQAISSAADELENGELPRSGTV